MSNSALRVFLGLGLLALLVLVVVPVILVVLVVVVAAGVMFWRAKGLRQAGMGAGDAVNF